MNYCLFIYSSHQHVLHITSQILLILIDFDRVNDKKLSFFLGGGGGGGLSERALNRINTVYLILLESRDLL